MEILTGKRVFFLTSAYLYWEVTAWGLMSIVLLKPNLSLHCSTALINISKFLWSDFIRIHLLIGCISWTNATIAKTLSLRMQDFLKSQPIFLTERFTAPQPSTTNTTNMCLQLSIHDSKCTGSLQEAVVGSGLRLDTSAAHWVWMMITLESLGVMLTSKMVPTQEQPRQAKARRIQLGIMKISQKIG